MRTEDHVHNAQLKIEHSYAADFTNGEAQCQALVANAEATLALVSEMRALRVALCGTKPVPGGQLGDLAATVARAGGVL